MITNKTIKERGEQIDSRRGWRDSANANDWAHWGMSISEYLNQSKLAKLREENQRLREALTAVQKRIELLAEDGVYWVDDPELAGFNLYQIDQVLKVDNV